MAFKNVEITPSSAVAQNGTFTAGYPEGTSAGSFAAFGHSMFSRGLQASFSQDSGNMSVSFGASDITVTYKGATSLPANKGIGLQLNMTGEDRAHLALIPDGVSKAPTYFVNLGSPDADDANGYVESQDLTAAGVFSVNTTAAAAIAAAALAGTADVPRNVVAAWTTAAVLTITGTDVDGNAMVESSASGTSFTGKKAFKTVTGISTSANITGLTVGTGDVIGIPVYVPHTSYLLGEMEDGALIGRPDRVYVQGQMLEAAIDAGTPLDLFSPVAGRIARVSTVARGTITTGGAITVEVNTVAVDGLSVVVADGAVAGEYDTDIPTADHATAIVAVGDRIGIIPALTFNASADMGVIVEIIPDSVGGTLVAGVQTTPTALTGDVRGTYAPATNPDGTAAFQLLLALPDPAYRGVDQYAG